MTTSNYNNYETIIKARRSKKFRDLDNKVRTMTIDLAKGNTNIDVKIYHGLVKQRDQELFNFYTATQIKPKKFDRTVYNKIDKKITSIIDTYIAKFPHQKATNIVFIGSTGTGKTYLSKLIEYELTQKGFTVHLTSTFNLVKRLRDNMYGQDHGVPHDFFETDLLIIDDLGSEPSTKDSDDLIYTVINERYANNEPILITTNLNREQVHARYDQRLYGRIFDQTRTAVITFAGKDLRIE